MDKGELFNVVKDALVALDQEAVVANVGKGLEAGIGPLSLWAA